MYPEIEQAIPTIPDWPIAGVQYRDITGLTTNPKAFRRTIDLITGYLSDNQVTAIAAPDARGFIFGAPAAYELNIPLHLIRKPNKLPPPTYEYEFEYEYANTSLSIKANANLSSTDRIGIVDDVNATAGTALAIANLLEKHYNISPSNMVYCSVIDIPSLNGSNKLRERGIKTYSIVTV